MLSQLATAGRRLAPHRNRHSAAFDGLADRFHCPGDPRPEGVSAAWPERRSEDTDRSGPGFHSRRPRPAIRRTRLTSCSDSSGRVRPLPRPPRRPDDCLPCSAQKVVGDRCQRWSPMPMLPGRPCTRFTPAGETPTTSRVRERRAVPPAYSARRWDLVCSLASFRISAVFRIGVPSWKGPVHLGGGDVLGCDGTGVHTIKGIERINRIQ